MLGKLLIVNQGRGENGSEFGFWEVKFQFRNPPEPEV